MQRRAAEKLAVADVETTPLEGGTRPRTLFWGLAVEGEDYRRFETTEVLFAFLARGSYRVYCHHDFDMIQAIMDGAALRIEIVAGGRVVEAKDNHGNRWLNSYKLFPTSLAKILASCGFAKPGLDQLEARNVADTVDALSAFRQLATAYQEVFGIDPLSGEYRTAASCAFASLELAAGPVPLDNTRREYYRGGRVEAFRVGDCGEATCYDINSSYPYSFADAPESDEQHLVDVTVKTRGPGPFNTLEQGKLVFPAGRFQTSVWRSNLDRYQAGAAVVKLKSLDKRNVNLSWVQAAGRFMRYVYYLRRKADGESNAALSYAIKICANSCYGRLGMHAVREGVRFSATQPDDRFSYSMPDGTFLTFPKHIAHARVNYAFASFITDNARARLYAALVANPEVFYCDTDSLFIPAGTAFVGETGTGLGQWKQEKTGPLTVKGLKDYTFAGTEKLKGGKGGYVWTIRRALKQGTVLESKRTRRSVYDKRLVLPSGATLPVTV